MPRLDLTLHSCLANVWVGVSLLIFGFIALIGLIVWIAWLSAKKRIREFERVAGEIGLPFYPQGNESLLSSLQRFHLFSLGSHNRIRNMLHGQSNDVELAIFDYSYTTGSGENASVHHQSVVFFRSPHLALPSFALRPESLFHKIGGAFGYQDIDFDSHPKFSKQYLLRGADEAAIRSLFDENLLTFLESQQQISIEGDGDQLVFYRSARRIKPAEVRDFMERGFEIYARFRRLVGESEGATAQAD